MTHYAILKILRAANGPLTPGQVTGKLLDTQPEVSRAEVTHQLEQLELQGMVEQPAIGEWRVKT